MVEDNLPDALLVEEIIRGGDLPLELHVATDGQQAIDFLARADAEDGAPCPHLVLLDLNLPKISGFEVLRHVRLSARCKEIPVVVMTSSDSPVDQRMACELGARYFRKPTDYEEFLKLGDVLKEVLEDRQPC